MSSDLDRLVAQGRDEIARERQRAAAAQRAAATTAAAAKTANDRAALRLATATTLRSISAATDWVFVLAIVGPPLFITVPLLGTTGFVLGGAGTLATLAALARVWYRRRALLRVTAALPFEVADLGLGLDWGRSYPSCKLTLDFAGDAPPDAVLEHAFAALRPRRPLQKVSVVKREGPRRVVIEIDSDEGSKFDGHRRWLVRWWFEATRTVLPALHRAHPLARVTFPS